MGIKTVQDASLTSVANAIRLKAEIEGTLEFPDEFVSAIQNIPTGGGSVSVPPKEVNFYDYDGTVVDAYTASEFASLSAMPKNPKHDGLTAQGWNWSLTDAKAYVAKYGRLNIGQMYVTTSGDTEIDIQLGIGRNKPYLGCCPNGTVDIDWGDGSAHDTLTGTSTTTLQSIQHTYPDTGEMFTIKLHMESGELGFKGNSGSSQLLYSVDTYRSAIKAVRLGNHVTRLGDYGLRGCSTLSSITMPENVTLMGQYAFYDCYALRFLTIPQNMTSISYYAFYETSLITVALPKRLIDIGNYAFNYCDALSSITIPEGISAISGSAFGDCKSLSVAIIPETVTTLRGSAFSYCTALSSVTIPKSVTSIESSAFYRCNSLARLIFEPTTPPRVANVSAFNSLPSDLVVYVPNGTLSAYQSASNYSGIADKMVEMPA